MEYMLIISSFDVHFSLIINSIPFNTILLVHIQLCFNGIEYDQNDLITGKEEWKLFPNNMEQNVEYNNNKLLFYIHTSSHAHCPRNSE